MPTIGELFTEATAGLTGLGADLRIVLVGGVSIMLIIAGVMVLRRALGLADPGRDEGKVYEDESQRVWDKEFNEDKADRWRR